MENESGGPCGWREMMLERECVDIERGSKKTNIASNTNRNRWEWRSRSTPSSTASGVNAITLGTSKSKEDIKEVREKKYAGERERCMFQML